MIPQMAPDYSPYQIFTNDKYNWGSIIYFTDDKSYNGWKTASKNTFFINWIQADESLYFVMS